MRKPAPRTAATLLASALLASMSLPLAASLATAAPVDNGSIEVEVVIPAARVLSTTNAQFRWGINAETSSGAYFGGCNFLSAGIAGDTRGSRIWTTEDDLYRSTKGSVSIVKPNAKGGWSDDSWAGRCKDSTGRTVGTEASEKGTGAQVVVESGTGTIDAAKGRATIRWKGAFTLASYGGMSYWSVSDPILTVANGKGTLRATASGYAADRSDSSVWKKVPSRTVTLATMSKVALGAKGIVVRPDYTGVKVDQVEPSQDRESHVWGSFPRDLVDFHAATGQASYWYSSGSLRDAAKVPSDIGISFSADDPVEQVRPTPDTNTSVPTQVPGTKPPAPKPTPAATPSPMPPRPVVPDPGTVIPGSPLGPDALGEGSVIASEPVPGIVRTAGTGTAQAVQWLGGTLVPKAVDLVKDHRDALLWSSAGLLALGSLGWVGFRRGWLVLPWKR